MHVHHRNAIVLDAEIFAIVQAIEAADTAVTRAWARTDEIAAKREGRVVEPADRAALDAAHDSYAAAIEALAHCTPCTPAGLAAALAALAKVDPPEHDWLAAALARLAGCPALADRA